MKVKFKNGSEKSCNTPVEQKVFRNGTAAGWILILTLVGEITSDELDEILTSENIGLLTFTTEPVQVEGEDTVAATEFAITGYDRLSSSVIRYAEDVNKTRVEIQFTKGV